jgi:hypothetical protein
MTTKYDTEIFENSEDVQLAVIWWLTYLLGGKVVISQDGDFWDTNLPPDRSLVLYKEDGLVYLAAERLDVPGDSQD